MAGAGYKLFQTGDVLTAAQVNTYLNEQTVMVFANAAARTSALTSVLAEGMVSYLQDTNNIEVYNGSAWVGFTGDITEVQAGTGISIASGTGPIPVITNTVATAFDAAGDLVYGTGADTFAKLGIGTAGQVLKVNSGATAPEWGAAAAGGSLIKISSTSFTTQASQAFDSVFSSSYSSYLIIIEELFTSTANNSMRFQWRYAGPTTQTTAYYNGFTGGSTTGSNFAGGGVSNGAHLQISTNVGNSSDQALRGYVKVFGCSGSSKIPHATYQTSNGYDGTTANGGGWVNQARTYTGFILTAAAGNITGTITIYGTAV